MRRHNLKVAKKKRNKLRGLDCLIEKIKIVKNIAFRRKKCFKLGSQPKKISTSYVTFMQAAPLEWQVMYALIPCFVW